MEAQTIAAPVTGEYYLQGVMETASWFKLNADNSFEFFFSYGALDREGSGHWKKEGNSIVFNSTTPQGHEYSLLQSKPQFGSGIKIKISGANGHLRKMVHAIVQSGSTTEQAVAGEEGFLYFKMTKAATITLLFEWCPEKKFVFTVPDTTHTYFEFQFEPSIMDVVFNNFRLQLDEAGFKGPHPMDTVKTFFYKKAGNRQDK